MTESTICHDIALFLFPFIQFIQGNVVFVAFTTRSTSASNSYALIRPCFHMISSSSPNLLLIANTYLIRIVLMACFRGFIVEGYRCSGSSQVYISSAICTICVVDSISRKKFSFCLVLRIIPPESR